MRSIPSTGEKIPAIGMGTWITFNVGGVESLRRDRLEVLRHFLERGGRLIDSSPMYGTAQEVVGWGLEELGRQDAALAADKIWTGSDSEGREQLAGSFRLWRRDVIDVMQVHNLVNTRSHLAMLREAKQEGRIRYIGLTTSHGSRHAEMVRLMREEDGIDFVQFSYNLDNRRAEATLLPLAAERGIGVIVNRPFRHKALFERYAHTPLPEWATEFEAGNWAQFFLKFVIAHPAVTCAIPATSQVVHMEENMGALYGRLPDAAMRKRMVAHIESI
jgi:diketogulonate reductase-like aldo/keto reductase